MTSVNSNNNSNESIIKSLERSNDLGQIAPRIVQSASIQRLAQSSIPNTDPLMGMSAKEYHAVHQEVEAYVKKHCTSLNSTETAETVNTVMISYARSGKVYGPVARAWTEYLLDKANKGNMKLVFMARDGVVPFKIAQKLMAQEEYQKKYPNLVGDKRIVLGYISRKIVENAQKTTEKQKVFEEYAAKELGISKDQHCLFVDVGFTGSMIAPLRKMLPNAKLEFDFLISRTKEAAGFVPQLDSFTPGGNFGVHWLEDTHQGNLESPSDLVKESNGRIYANSARPQNVVYSFPRNSKEYLLRKFSQRAVVRTGLMPSDLQAANKNFNETMDKIKGKAIPIFASHVPLKPDFHSLFSSELFKDYVQHLGDHVTRAIKNLKGLSLKGPFTHPIQKHTVEFIDLISGFKGSSNNDRREFYEQIVLRLRALINEKHQLPYVISDAATLESIQFIEDLSAFIYSGTSMFPEIGNFMSKYISQADMDELSTLPSSDLPQWIKTKHDRLPRDNDLKGIDEGKRKYDPRLLGDIPTVLFEYPLAKKKVTIIRTPTTVRDVLRNTQNMLESAQVVEEFTGFLDSRREQNKTHLYVNLMDRNSASESIRTRCIEGLEKKYPATLQVITLAKNSDFYHQKGTWDLPSMEFVDFKKKFMDEMYSNSSGFRWPASLADEQWKKICSHVLDQVHQKYFKDVANLNKQERKDFIEIAYTEIIEAALQHLNFDSCNVSCLSTVDRGAAVLTELFIKSCRKVQGELESGEKQKVVSMVFAPAILAQNRVMQQDRMERFHSASQCMLA